MSIPSLSDLCHKQLHKRNRYFIVNDEPETIKIFLYVIQNMMRLSFLQLSERQVLVFK